MNNVKLLDISNTITNYFTIVPEIFSDEKVTVVQTVLWNIINNEEGHTAVSVVLDATNETLTVVESEGYPLNLYQKYCIAGIATTNALKFDVIISDECMSCSHNTDVTQSSASSSEDKDDSNTTCKRQPILH